MTGIRYITARVVRLRRSGAWLGLFALIFQAVVPLSGMPAMRGVNDLSWGLSSFCDIGSPLQAEPASRGEGQGDQNMPPCPICQVLQQFGTFIPPTGNAEIFPFALSIAGGVTVDMALPQGRIPWSNQARAPPILA